MGKVRIWESIGEIGKWGSLDQNLNMEKPGRTIGSLKIKLNLGNEGPNDYWLTLRNVGLCYPKILPS